MLELPLLNTTGEVACFSDVTDQDKLEFAHMRTGHASESVLIEGFRRGLFTGTGLDRKHLRQKLKVCANGVPRRRLQKGHLG